jgi:hypothetical protein
MPQNLKSFLFILGFKRRYWNSTYTIMKNATLTRRVAFVFAHLASWANIFELIACCVPMDQTRVVGWFGLMIGCEIMGFAKKLS